jgi:Holliday junction resolvase RusA-like endonuclease
LPDRSEAIEFFVPGEPVAFARSGGNGAVRFTPKRQRDFMGLVKLAAHTAMQGRPVLEGALKATIIATYSIPASWSKKKRAEIASRWKTSRSDIDNLVKILADSLNEIVYHDDAQIACLYAEKVYGEPTGFSIKIEALA